MFGDKSEEIIGFDSTLGVLMFHRSPRLRVNSCLFKPHMCDYGTVFLSLVVFCVIIGLSQLTA